MCEQHSPLHTGVMQPAAFIQLNVAFCIHLGWMGTGWQLTPSLLVGTKGSPSFLFLLHLGIFSWWMAMQPFAEEQRQEG